MAVIEVHNLTKVYGALRAVDDLSFTVGRGEVVAFLGPNGAGKTTTLRILSGFLGATRGVVRIHGKDVSTQAAEARAAVGYMPESCPLYPEMRVREYLRFRAELKGVARSRRKEAVERAVSSARLEDVEDVLIGQLSKGYRQRVGLADALVSSPPLLILDEPTAGLDPNQILEVRALIRSLGQEHTVLLSTHILSEVESICSRALVLSRGRLVASGTLTDLRALQGGRSLELTLGVPDPTVRARLWSVLRNTGTGHVQELTRADEASAPELDLRALASQELRPRDREDDELCVRVDLGSDGSPNLATEALVSKLASAGAGIRKVLQRDASLEQVFAELTGATGQTGTLSAPPSSVGRDRSRSHS